MCPPMEGNEGSVWSFTILEKIPILDLKILNFRKNPNFRIEKLEMFNFKIEKIHNLREILKAKDGGVVV